MPGPATGASATFNPTTPLTNNAGVASVAATANALPGIYQVTASVGNLSAQFSLKNTTTTVRFSVTATPAVIAASQTTSVIVTALDAFGNVDPFYSGTVRLTSNDPLTIFAPQSGTLTGGTGTFDVTFRSSGLKTITAADTRTSSITGNTNIRVSALVNVQGTVFIPLVNQQFTTTVTTFTPVFAAVSKNFTASINWADGTTTFVTSTAGPNGQIVSNGSGGFNVIGTHTYTTVTTFLVQVTVNDLLNNTVETTVPTGAVVLNAGQDAQLQSFGFTSCSFATVPGVLSTSSSGAAAMLVQPMTNGCNQTLFVADYGNDPNSVPTGGVLFYDVRATGVTSVGRLVATFSYGSLDPNRVQLKVFDSKLGQYVAVSGSTVGGMTLINDPVSRTITVLFDGSSFPTLSNLNGTVFTITVVGFPFEVSSPSYPTVALNLTTQNATPNSVSDTPSTLRRESGLPGEQRPLRRRAIRPGQRAERCR